MLAFNKKFPEQNMIGIKVTQDEILPKGMYILLDFICTNQNCDCKGCVIEVIKKPLVETAKLKEDGIYMASIDFYWGEKFRNKKICHVCRQYKISLRNDYKQSEYAEDILKWFRSLVHNEMFVSTIKKRYNRFKRSIIESEQSTLALSKSFKISRNDPCSCGSGKKFKRCCAT